MNATYGLEYALFFGVPGNKIELLDGTSRWSFPFLSRDEAEAHFHDWLQTLRRWKQADAPTPIKKSDKLWRAKFNGIRLRLFPRPIRINIPVAWEPFEAFLDTFNRRDFWPGQPEGQETGWDSMWDLSDIGMNVWSLLGALCSRFGGKHCGRTDIALTDWAGVAPDGYYYGPDRTDIMIEGDYFCSPPDLIVEVLTAASRWLDRGPRMDVYRRAGVGHLWLVEPATETVDVYELRRGYELLGRYGAGDGFACSLFPGETIAVNRLFKTQSKSKGWRRDEAEELERIPDWIVPPELNVGLEYFFYLGHPERRWEFWDNKARSVLAFGSSAEARARLDYFLTEACRWESLPRPRISPMADDVELTEVGRFQFTRRGRLVFLDVAIDGRRHRELLARWSNRDAWDWGDDR